MKQLQSFQLDELRFFCSVLFLDLIPISISNSRYTKWAKLNVSKAVFRLTKNALDNFDDFGMKITVIYTL